MRLMRRPGFRWVATAATLAAGAIIILANQYGLRFLGPRGPDEPVPVPTGAPSLAVAGTRELSVVDQPRDLPEIRFADAEGRALTLADFRGKMILLNIWATWCVPCRKEMPALDRLQAQLGGDEFLVVPLSIDRAGVTAVKRFYDELGLKNLAIYVDTSGVVPRAFSAPGVPTTLLIERDGRESARKVGPAEWDSAEMLALFRRHIAARPGPEPGTRP